MPRKNESKPKRLGTQKKAGAKTKEPDNLVVIAHPDDEALFFAGLILSQKKSKWHIICVTDGNADGMGALRAKQFDDASDILKSCKHEVWNFPDKFEERLDVNDLIARLNDLPKYKRVFTHCILGEYGHPHHQDVCYAVHTSFRGRSSVFSVAHNSYPDLKVSLTPEQFAVKANILWRIYGSEVKRFINFVPATSHEAFSKVSFEEVFSIYAWLAGGRTLNVDALKKYKWLEEWLQGGGGTLTHRPF